MSLGEELLTRLDRAAKRAIGREGAVGVAFSGGLDSALLAELARKRCEVSLYAVGYPASRDLREARRVANHIELPLREIPLTDLKLISGLRAFRATTQSGDSHVASFELPLLFVLSLMHERVLLSGQGADELFGGYARYLREADPTAAMAADLQRLLSEGWPREERLALKFDRLLRCPYLDPEIRAFARGLPLDQKVRNGARKIVLREAAAAAGLVGLALGQKSAAQYGTGIARAMRHLARAERLSVQEWYDSLMRHPAASDASLNGGWL